MTEHGERISRLEEIAAAQQQALRGIQTLREHHSTLLTEILAELRAGRQNGAGS